MVVSFSCRCCFNPRPPRRAGATGINLSALVFTPVSILAHPEGRALQRRLCNPWMPYRFQSSPTPKGGRYYQKITFVDVIESFNPRPPRRAGATPWYACNALDINVSILAHPEGRALPSSARALTALRWFQSSPTPKGGRYEAKRAVYCAVRCFNPRPPRRAGATQLNAAFATADMFQSSPTPKGGRYKHVVSVSGGKDRFQSSPTPKGGRYSPPTTS